MNNSSRANKTNNETSYNIEEDTTQSEENEPFRCKIPSKVIVIISKQ